MPAIDRPSGKPLQSVTDYLSEKLRPVLGPENPPVHIPLEAAGQAASYMAGPDNPPVNALVGLLRKGGDLMGKVDPMGLMSMGNPVGMVLKHKYLPGGQKVRINPYTGAEVGMTSKEARGIAGVTEKQAQTIRAAEEQFDGPFKSVAFKNRETGEVIPGGHTHPSSMERIPANWYKPGENQYDTSNVIDGFIERATGRFVDRAEAMKVPNAHGESFTGMSKGSYGPKLGFDDKITIPGTRGVTRRVAGLLGDLDQKAWREAVEKGLKPTDLDADVTLREVVKMLRAEKAKPAPTPAITNYPPFQPGKKWVNPDASRNAQEAADRMKMPDGFISTGIERNPVDFKTSSGLGTRPIAPMGAKEAAGIEEIIQGLRNRNPDGMRTVADMIRDEMKARQAVINKFEMSPGGKNLVPMKGTPPTQGTSIDAIIKRLRELGQ